MHIIQLIDSDKSGAILRYSDELKKSTNVYYNEFSIENYYFKTEDPNNRLLISESSFFILESADYLFIHSLPNKNSNNIYSKIINNIQTKKVLFIHYHNVKELYANVNINFFRQLLFNCHIIFVYSFDKLIKEELLKILGEELYNKVVKDMHIIYNFDSKPNFDNLNYKSNSILFVDHSHNTLCDKYISIYKNYKDKLDNVYEYSIYGVVKNVQTMNINDLYINTKTNETSKITNFDDNIDINKLNIRKNLDYDKFIYKVQKSKLVYDFSPNLTYTILDSINNGTVVVTNKQMLKSYSINSKQSLYDINMIPNDEISYNQLNMIVNNTTIYKDALLKTYNMLKSVLNAKNEINNIYKNIGIIY